MSAANAKVVFTPSGLRGSFAHGTPVLDAARSLGVDIDSVCGGRGLCGRCQVECAEGEFTKHAITSSSAHLSAAAAVEKRFNEGRKPLSSKRRLSCQARIQGDLVIDVPPTSQLHRQLVRKQAEHRDIVLEASVHLYYIEVQEADMFDPSGDLQRLYDALSSTWQIDRPECDPLVLPGLQSALRQGKWRVTVALLNQTRVIAIWPGLMTRAYGLAIDIGSTTIAVHLCDLSSGEVVATGGSMNPQIRFGEDLMSRVSYLMMHPEGAHEMTVAVRQGINDLVMELTRKHNIEAHTVLQACIAGNPIMHHLMLGLSPIELGSAPFALATDAALNLNARALDLKINPGADVYILPCIAGHVGADAAAMILAEEPYLLEQTSLLIDVGTNAEIVLGNRDHLWACSSPTGPAFEGAQISCGQRAAPGAIERVRIDPETLEVRFSVIGSDIWSDEAGFADATKAHGVTGICGSGIIEVVAGMYLSGIISEDGVIDASLAGRCPRLIQEGRTWSFILHADGQRQITVTQLDIRQIQLAKAALYAGVKLLMKRAGIDSVDRIRLAGAFGSHIDPQYAMVLGLIPDCEFESVSSAGNAAGTGARIALLNTSARKEIEGVVRDIEKIETAVEPGFQELFVDAMAFPNKKDKFPKLFSVLNKPAPKQASASANRESSQNRRRRTGRKRR